MWAVDRIKSFGGALLLKPKFNQLKSSKQSNLITDSPTPRKRRRKMSSND